MAEQIPLDRSRYQSGSTVRTDGIPGPCPTPGCLVWIGFHRPRGRCLPEPGSHHRRVSSNQWRSRYGCFHFQRWTGPSMRFERKASVRLPSNRGWSQVTIHHTWSTVSSENVPCHSIGSSPKPNRSKRATGSSGSPTYRYKACHTPGPDALSRTSTSRSLVCWPSGPKTLTVPDGRALTVNPRPPKSVRATHSCRAATARVAEATAKAAKETTSGIQSCTAETYRCSRAETDKLGFCGEGNG